jgi:hypothetical protein
MQNTNDRKNEQAAKPSAGGNIRPRPETKYSKDGRDDQPSVPNSGGEVHADNLAAHERGNVANPSASGPHDRGKDKANQATPDAGTYAEHTDKVKFDDQHKEAQRGRL